MPFLHCSTVCVRSSRSGGKVWLKIWNSGRSVGLPGVPNAGKEDMECPGGSLLVIKYYLELRYQISTPPSTEGPSRACKRAASLTGLGAARLQTGSRCREWWGQWRRSLGLPPSEDIAHMLSCIGRPHLLRSDPSHPHQTASSPSIRLLHAHAST